MSQMTLLDIERLADELERRMSRSIREETEEFFQLIERFSETVGRLEAALDDSVGMLERALIELDRDVNVRKPGVSLA